MKLWIGIDLDGTLAHYDGSWIAEDIIGEPIPASVEFVKRLLKQGEDVRIFTARTSLVGRDADRAFANTKAIQAWCEKHIGQVLPVTCEKDRYTKAIFDDIALGVVKNRGIEMWRGLQWLETVTARR